MHTMELLILDANSTSMIHKKRKTAHNKKDQLSFITITYLTIKKQLNQQ
jgi:hypothetical protein